MEIARRRVVAVDEVTMKLDALASENNIEAHGYAEAAADSINEFDALKWSSLCAQRRALMERETRTADANSF